LRRRFRQKPRQRQCHPELNMEPSHRPGAVSSPDARFRFVIDTWPQELERGDGFAPARATVARSIERGRILLALRPETVDKGA
jgi:hypothetical protein